MVNDSAIIDAYAGTRTEFRRLFAAAQTTAEIPPDAVIDFEALAMAAPDAESYRCAYQYAAAHGFTRDLVIAVLSSGTCAAGALPDLVRTVLADDPVMRTPTVRHIDQYDEPHVVLAGYRDGIRWTAKIEVAGQARGTGILIAPHLIITAWHVVRELFVLDGAGRYVSDPARGTLVRVVFDDYLAGRGAGVAPRAVKGNPVELHRTGWCVAFSPCHRDELNGNLPEDPAELKAHWDYAILRLAEPFGLDRNWPNLNGGVLVPGARDRMYLFQHPAGQPMKVDEGAMALSQDDGCRYAPYRFLHQASSEGGSSGGPCFDAGFRLFGLHQGKWHRGNAPAGGPEPVNRGIPLASVIDHFTDEIGELPPLPPEDNPRWSLSADDPQDPVIGCREFQAKVWRLAVATGPSIMTIVGDPGTGKTFRVDLLAAMLPVAQHLLVRLPGQSIVDLDAADLAQQICLRAGAPAPVIQPEMEHGATAATWLKDAVARPVIELLDQSRRGRLVWLLLTDLNRFGIKDIHASELLYRLYELAPSVGWLRIVLDGMQGDIPGQLQPHWIEEECMPITQEEIRRYFKRLWVAQGLDRSIDNRTTSAIAGCVFAKYQRQRAGRLGRPAQVLVDEVRDLVQAFLAVR